MGSHDLEHVELASGPRPVLKTATGKLLKHYGQHTVDFWCQDQELRVSFTVLDVKQPIMSVSRLVDRGIETIIRADNQMVAQIRR